MKICWDNIEGIEYVPKKGIFRRREQSEKYKGFEYFDYIDECNNCGQPFFTRRMLKNNKKYGTRGFYCSRECTPFARGHKPKHFVGFDIKTEELLNIKNKKVRNKLYMLIVSARKRAGTRGMGFNLDCKWLVENLTDRCQATGIDFDYTKPGMAPSLDRIDSSKGYTKDNCQLVLWCFNRMKSNTSEHKLYKIYKSYVELYEQRHNNERISKQNT